jgi:hypothetical protein
MAITVINGTVTLTYAATQAQLTKVLSNAAQYLYPRYQLFDNSEYPAPIPFSTLTNAQKLAIIDKHIRREIVEAAKSNVSETLVSTARTTAEKDDQTIS